MGGGQLESLHVEGTPRWHRCCWTYRPHSEQWGSREPMMLSLGWDTLATHRWITCWTTQIPTLIWSFHPCLTPSLSSRFSCIGGYEVWPGLMSQSRRHSEDQATRCTPHLWKVSGGDEWGRRTPGKPATLLNHGDACTQPLQADIYRRIQPDPFSTLIASQTQCLDYYHCLFSIIKLVEEEQIFFFFLPKNYR